MKLMVQMLYHKSRSACGECDLSGSFLCMNKLGIYFVILQKSYSFCLTITYCRVHVVVCTLTGPDRRCLFHRFCVCSPDWSRFLRVCQTTPGGFLYCAGTLRPVIDVVFIYLFFKETLPPEKRVSFRMILNFYAPAIKWQGGI